MKTTRSVLAALLFALALLLSACHSPAEPAPGKTEETTVPITLPLLPAPEIPSNAEDIVLKEDIFAKNRGLLAVNPDGVVFVVRKDGALWSAF